MWLLKFVEWYFVVEFCMADDVQRCTRTEENIYLKKNFSMVYVDFLQGAHGSHTLTLASHLRTW